MGAWAGMSSFLPPDPGGCRGLGRGRGGRGRRGRVFDHGDLRLIILVLLAEKPRHGYEIIKALEERVGGGYSPSPGVIYPTLMLLEETGQASVREEGGGRKLYTLTEQGAATVAASRHAIAAMFARLDAAVAGRGLPPELARALDGLNEALRLCLQRGDLDAARTRALVEAIQAAARAAEDS
jgi:DNA-binding PadR family transcriptional regulator